MKRLRIPTFDELQTALGDLVEWYAHSNIQDIEEYVVKLRAQNPGIAPDDLARKIVRRKALKCVSSAPQPECLASSRCPSRFQQISLRVGASRSS